MDAAKSTKPYRIGFLPFASYNDDQGLAYGFVLQLDDQRPGEFTPYYLSHRLAITRTTRGIGDYNYRLDSKYLLPAELRLTLVVSSYTSLFEPYHGPGGARTNYDAAFIDEGSASYRGRFYYMYAKRSLKVSTLVQGRLKGDKFRWLAGVVLISTQVDSIDYDDYDGDDPGRQSLLAKHWNSYGAAVDGGRENGLVGGLVWDSRDHEASPQRRLWSELLARWVLWQRAVGRQLFYSNWELRYRVRQLFRSGYLAASAFYDLGRTFDPADANDWSDSGTMSDSWHAGVGAGLRIALSDTFILALDLGWPRDPDLDGQGVKVYMGLDWLF
ncbi:MAG: BamA/TamA family outer membrane protein [Candidatus Marinimicrobia bacterium]|nr:BamA/TamA family outer membrane protein [Candidatus Neomarinimicrobiota bacterium]